MPERVGSAQDDDHEWLKNLLGDAARLRRVFQSEPGLVNRLAANPGFLESLFAEPAPFRAFLEASPVPNEQALDGLIELLGGNDGASMPARRPEGTLRLERLLRDADASAALFRARPELVELAASNPAFFEQVKVLKPNLYRAILEKGKQRFAGDAAMLSLIAAEESKLPPGFTSEGGIVESPGKRERRELSQKLLEAVSENDANMVRALLERGADPNAQDQEGWTALMGAAWWERTDTVSALLDAGADPNAQRPDGSTALMEAARWGCDDIVAALLERGADPNAQDQEGWTALMKAVIGGNPEVVGELLENGANPLLRNKEAKKASDFAEARGNWAVSQLLARAEQRLDGHSKDGPEPRR